MVRRWWRKPAGVVAADLPGVVGAEQGVAELGGGLFHGLVGAKPFPALALPRAGPESHRGVSFFGIIFFGRNLTVFHGIYML
jgi:hypothetical protein